MEMRWHVTVGPSRDYLAWMVVIRPQDESRGYCGVSLRDILARMNLRLREMVALNLLRAGKLMGEEGLVILI